MSLNPRNKASLPRPLPPPHGGPRRGAAATTTARRPRAAATSAAAAALLLLAALALAAVRRGAMTAASGPSLRRSDPPAAALPLLSRPGSDEKPPPPQQQQQQQPEPADASASGAAAATEGPTRLWSFEEIDHVLGCDSRRIVDSSVQHLRAQMDRARSLAPTNRTVYGTLHDPLFGFFIAKTGSNTQEYYQLEALAAIGQLSYKGCEGRNPYRCLQTEPDLSTGTCRAVAFGNHFAPQALIPELVKASCTADARGWEVDPSSPTKVGDVLGKYGVCTAVFRNPLERIVSGFYEWSYRKTTQDTAIEHWRKHGAAPFPKPQPQGSFIGMYNFIPNDPGAIQPKPDQKQDLSALEAVMGSCVIGVTENMNDYVTTLSRILWIQPPAPRQGALKARSRERHGMASTTTDADTNGEEEQLAAWTEQLYQELEAYARHDMAVWNLARRVAAAQVRAATEPPHHTPIIPRHLVPKEQRRTIEGNCRGCTRCTPPEFGQYRWTSYAAAAPTAPEIPASACVGPNIRADGFVKLLPSRLCCAHAPDT